MRFSLYGRGEGVRAAETSSLYMTTLNGQVTDASISARKKGVVRGLSSQAALALVPDILDIQEPEHIPDAMKRVYEILFCNTPWIETIEMDGFCVELTNSKPPLEEVRGILRTLNEELSGEQRFRVGFAENPFLARVLVEWSHIERVPDVLYRRVGRQHLLISPGLYQREKNALIGSESTVWIQELPIDALWMVSEAHRAKLKHLGLFRLRDVMEMKRDVLVQQFGKEVHLWFYMLKQMPTKQVKVNYPPAQFAATWQASIGEFARFEELDAIVYPLVEQLSHALREAGLGTRSLGISIGTDCSETRHLQPLKRVVVHTEDLYAELSSILTKLVGRTLDYFQLSAHSLTKLNSLQSSFVLYENAFYPQHGIPKNQMEITLNQLSLRFQGRIQQGLQPTFRERRMEEILGNKKGIG